jgi:hypothetical protein
MFEMSMDANSTLTQLLAVWGALLSTFLAGVKFWELWDKRLKIDISPTWTGSEEEGHTIRIRNLSSFPVILSGWELFYRRPRSLTPQDEMIEESSFDWNDVTIEPSSTFALEFKEQYHFSTHKTLSGMSIYIKLYFAGCRTITQQIKEPEN